MKVALAQINATVGDLVGNAAKIIDCARRAHGGTDTGAAAGAGLVSIGRSPSA